jgi:predicted transcriptional regulator
MSATTAVSVKIPIEDKKRLAAFAKQTNRSSHYILREAIHSHLNVLQARLEFVQEAEEALRDYDATGLHLTVEDMEAWAKSGMGELPPWRK